MKYDFSGWATRNNLRCSDGRTIMKDAFKNDDGTTRPLVWNHQHNSPDNILGHAVLENRDDGVYAYCLFNDTDARSNAKLLVEHGDVTALSIYANQLKQQGANVIHGAIKEVSLVLAGANPGAFIDNVLSHGEDGGEYEALIYSGEPLTICHSSESAGTDEKPEEKTESDDETVADVFNTLNEKQKNVVYALVGQALSENGEATKEEETDTKNEEETKSMKHNVFDTEDTATDVLSHSDMEAIFADAKRYGSLKDSVLAHGIEDIDYLFPDAKNVTDTPLFIKRETDWVQKVMSGVHHSPFSRVRSILADITADDARAKGYVKGNQKVEEVFTLLKRTTTSIL